MMIPQPPIARPRAVVGTPIAPYKTPMQRAYHILNNTYGYADRNADAHADRNAGR